MFIVSIATRINGTVVTPESALIDGVFAGTLEAGQSIIVTDRAIVSGVLIADEITIDGQVDADVYASRLVLNATATVRGRIFHADLELAANTFFEGQSRRYEDPRAVWRGGGSS
jgi:cytoskeletal protein CcmA (bactofilin family)